MRGIADRLSNAVWEYRLNISTRGRAPTVGDHPDATHYATLSYSFIARVLDRLDLQLTDAFVDVGCGKGRVLCLAARKQLGSVIGIEIAGDLAQACRENTARARGLKTTVSVWEGAAELADYSTASVAYLFSPFGAQTLDRVLSRIERDRDGRPVRLAYSNPSHQDVFQRHTFLELYDYWPDRADQHGVAFFSSRR